MFVVNEVILYEISVVSIGCNGETEYTGLKSTDQIDDAYQQLQEQITSELKDLTINKRSAIQGGLLSKTWALANVKPVDGQKGHPRSPLNRKQAAGTEDLFSGVKFNNIKK